MLCSLFSFSRMLAIKIDADFLAELCNFYEANADKPYYNDLTNLQFDASMDQSKVTSYYIPSYNVRVAWCILCNVGETHKSLAAERKQT